MRIILLILLLLMITPCIYSTTFCVVNVPDHQFLTGIGGGNQGALTKMFTYIRDTVATTFGCSLAVVVGEGDQINTPCNAVSSSVEELLAYNNWAILGTAGIRWTVTAGNHEYLNAAVGTRSPVNMSEDWKDVTVNCPTATIPTPGQFSPLAFVSRGLGFTSSSQFWGMSAGYNQNSYMRWNQVGYHGVMVMNLDFFPTNGELTSADAILNANPYDDVIVTTHAAMNPTNSTNHIAQYLGQTCVGTGTFCNAFYGLDASNSNSGQQILAWAKTHSNIVAITNGHYFASPTTLDSNWSTRTDTANDGHTIIGVHGDWQDKDQTPSNSSGTAVPIGTQVGGSGTCPNVGSTGCTAEVGFIMPMVIDTVAHTASYYALSTNTGHWVASGNTYPQPGNSMTPIATFTYNGTAQAIGPDMNIDGKVTIGGKVILK